MSAPPAERPSGWSGQWLGMCGLLALLSFSWLPNSYTRMVNWPYALIWQGAFLVWIGWSLWMSRQFSLPLRRLGHGLDWIVLLSVAGCGLSTLNAQFGAIAYWNLLLFLSYIIVLYTAVNWIRHCPQVKKTLWILLSFSGTITHLISLCSWRPSTEMWLGRDFYSAIRNPFPLGHHNFVGGYCVLTLPLIFGLTCAQRRKYQGRWHWIGYGVIAINFIALYVSGSRGAMLGTITLFATALPMYCWYHRPQKIAHWALVVCFVLFVLGASLSNPRVRSLATVNPSATSTFSIEQIGDGPTKDRLFMLQTGQKILKDYPLLGIGPGNLSRLYNRYRPIEAGGGLELVQQLHSTPAQILAELGIVGLINYSLLVAWLVKTGTNLHRKIQSSQDRILLYSISASWFAYAVSSLTDYQLENIGISSILLLTVVLWIALADEYSDKAIPTEIKIRTRRFLSIGLLFFLSLTIQAWARADASFYLHHSAEKSVDSFDYATADAKWTKASELMPQDPTAAALSAEQLIDIEKTTSDTENSDKLREAAIASMNAAIKAAPNDPWFHQNLAVLLLSKDPQQSQVHLRRTILLSPRSAHHTYYTLGRSYLNQKEQSKAIVAFALEGLINPEFLADPIWRSASLSSLLPAVVDKTLDIQLSILDSTAPNSRQHAWLHRQMTLIQWWYQKPLTSLDGLPPLAKAVLLIEDNSEDAIQLLQKIVEAGSKEAASKAALLLAWHSPEDRLSLFLSSLNVTKKEKQALSDNIVAYRNLREWLASLAQPMPTKLRFSLSFAYRNAAANNIRQILLPEGLSHLPLLEDFVLFSEPPREFSQLDRKITEIAQKELNIPFS